MKRFYLIILAITVALSGIFIYNRLNIGERAASGSGIQSKNTVVIDAGHGGSDAGTVAADGTKEKDINLSIALILRDYLMVCGINTILIRENDTEFYPEGTDTSKSDLYNRLELVSSTPNAVLLSIHQNHFSDVSEWGTQIWYSENDAESKIIADSVLSNIKELMQPQNERENKPSGSSYYILYKATVPSIMVECGFMSNLEENEKLKTESYKNKLAYSILTGICGLV